MDIQTRKLNAIQYVAGLREKKLLSKIEATIQEVQKSELTKRRVEKLTDEQLLARAEESESDYANGKFLTQEELEEEFSEIALKN